LTPAKSGQGHWFFQLTFPGISIRKIIPYETFMYNLTQQENENNEGSM